MVLEFCGSQTLKKFVYSTKTTKINDIQDISNNQASLNETHETNSQMLFKQLIDGVCHLHTKGIYHRDLKLSNILVNAKKVLKIIDLGLATCQSEPFQSIVGTPAYYSPQAAAGSAYSARAQDIWSLGVILFELLFGSNPFYGNFDSTNLRSYGPNFQE